MFAYRRLGSVLAWVVGAGLLAACQADTTTQSKTDTNTQFIDASGLFKKETNNNVLLDAHIEQIMQAFDSKTDVEHFAKSVSLETITANDYNLSVSSYVEAKEAQEFRRTTGRHARGSERARTNCESCRLGPGTPRKQGVTRG